MKKITEVLAKIFTAVAIIPIASLSIVACTNTKTNDSNNNYQSAENQSQGSGSTDNNENVSDKNEERANSLNGFYTFSGNYSRENIIYADKQAALDFFGTRDLNGMFYKAEEIFGLKNFVSGITTHEDKPVSICIKTNTNAQTDENLDDTVPANAFIYLIKTGDYSFLPIDENLHNITITENGYETSDEDPIIAYDEETNTLNLIYQFTYTDAEGNVVETPLYYKTTLTYEDFYNSDIEKNFKAYTFTETSTLTAEIPEELIETVTDEDVANEIATKFGYTGEEISLEAINNYLHVNTEKFLFLSNDNYVLGEWVNFDNLNNVNFIPQSEDGSFSVAGLNFTLTYSEDGNQAIFTATLDCGAVITFTLNLSHVSTPPTTDTTEGEVNDETHEDIVDNESEDTENA